MENSVAALRKHSAHLESDQKPGFLLHSWKNRKQSLKEIAEYPHSQWHYSTAAAPRNTPTVHQEMAEWAQWGKCMGCTHTGSVGYYAISKRKGLGRRTTAKSVCCYYKAALGCSQLPLTQAPENWCLWLLQASAFEGTCTAQFPHTYSQFLR